MTNFYARYTYGNRTRGGLKICHWNKSNAKMQSRIAEIKEIISCHQLHLLGISEANIYENQDMNLISIPSYKHFLGPPSPTGIIRIVVYVHNDIKVKLRKDLMHADLNLVWLEAGFPNTRKILINNLYREWRHLGDDCPLSIPDQLENWVKHLQYWETALNSGMEVVSLGDYNINHCNWTDSNVSRSNQT